MNLQTIVPFHRWKWCPGEDRLELVSEKTQCEWGRLAATNLRKNITEEYERWFAPRESLKFMAMPFSDEEEVRLHHDA